MSITGEGGLELCVFDVCVSIGGRIVLFEGSPNDELSLDHNVSAFLEILGTTFAGESGFELCGVP